MNRVRSRTAWTKNGAWTNSDVPSDRKADLTEADLTEADLTEAILTDAELQQASFKGAIVSKELIEQGKRGGEQIALTDDEFRSVTPAKKV